jgi:formate-dependent nitrite reductase membrane component NrfD
MMNQGAWGLTVFSGFAGLALLAQLAEDFSARAAKGAGGGIRPRRSMLGNAVRAITWMGIPAAAYVGSYTGVLLSSTNVPLWAGNPRYLGPLFFASALGSGIAGTHLTARLLGPVSEATEERLHQAENVVTAAEIALTAASRASLGRLAKPLKEGKMSKAFKVGYLALGLAAPLALRPLAKKRPWLGLLSSALSLAGTAMLKYAVTEAGKESADDPQAYFEYTSPER